MPWSGGRLCDRKATRRAVDARSTTRSSAARLVAFAPGVAQTTAPQRQKPRRRCDRAQPRGLGLRRRPRRPSSRNSAVHLHNWPLMFRSVRVNFEHVRVICAIGRSVAALVRANLNSRCARLKTGRARLETDRDSMNVLQPNIRPVQPMMHYVLPIADVALDIIETCLPSFETGLFRFQTRRA
jgi:hypothetical protein